MTCRELCEFIMEYLDGEMPEAIRVHFERHISLCPPCERYLRQYRATIAAGRACAEDPPLPGDVPEELINAILEARRRAES